MAKEFTPLDILDDLMNYWWLIIISMLFGAVIGYIIHSFKPAVYETHASLGVSIDYSRTGFLSDFEIDEAYGTVADVFSTPKVVDDVVRVAKENGIDITPELLKEVVIHERTNNSWIFRARYKDPIIAAKLANIWLDSSYKTLEQANYHAILIQGLERYLDSLVSCMEQMTITEPTYNYCQTANIQDIQGDLEKTAMAINAEKESSYGIVPGMSFRISDYAMIPVTPVRYGRGMLVLSGAVLGLLLGIVLVYVKFPSLVTRKLNHDR